ncbi:hypothetical protein BGW36DRAFT_381372 [Talaromyces proteolyticus]|uniref:Uncharacterized protein n=1 Tax=Talaromyces proteolyticus TaxID=1131652 RepID=A0AAD4KTN0_9EURO|nr:uncharacterized protein BGW36DRAFT_381372 [Talaromyces proteolyticus]KAH8696645.1 hypothetical protein BGW36DRAFT_381372 [Talaromyces proteolyticus]
MFYSAGTPSVITTIGVTQTSSVASSTILTTSKASVSSSLTTTTALSNLPTSVPSILSEPTLTSSSMPAAVTPSSADLQGHQKTVAVAASIPSVTVICLIGLGMFIYLRRRKRLNQQQTRGLELNDRSYSLFRKASNDQDTKPPGDFNDHTHTQHRYEVPGDESQRFELPATPGLTNYPRLER